MATFTAGQILTAAEMNQLGDDTGWVAVIGGVGYQNSWVTYARACEFRRIGNRVTIRGGVSTGTSGASCFILPVGYRPTQQVNFACNNGNSTFGATQVYVLANGVVQPMSNTYGVYLDSISFLVD